MIRRYTHNLACNYFIDFLAVFYKAGSDWESRKIDSVSACRMYNTFLSEDMQDVTYTQYLAVVDEFKGFDLDYRIRMTIAQEATADTEERNRIEDNWLLSYF